MSQANQITRSVTTNWMALAVNIGVSFFLSPFVVNKLGSVYYGIWALTMQFTGYLFLLDFGVRESVVRYTSKYVARNQERQLNQTLTAAFCIYVPVTLLCIALSALCAWQIPHWFDIDPSHHSEASWAILFVGLTIAQTFVFNVFNGILQGLQRFDAMNLTGIVGAFLRAALIVVFLNNGYGMVAVAVIQFAVAVLSGLVIAAIALSTLRKAGASFHFVSMSRRRLFGLMRKISGYGWWVLVNNVAQKINFASDAIVVAAFLPVKMVTYYAIAGSLIEYLRSLITSTAQVFNPLASRLHSLRQTEQLRSVLVSGAKLTVLVTLPIALTYALLGKEFIGLWMGPEYQELSGQVLMVLAVTQILAAPHYVISSVLYGMSQHRSIALLRCGEAAVKLTLSIVLVKRMGLIGVALGTAISHSLLVLFILPGIVCRRIDMNVARYFAGVFSGPLLAALPFTACVWAAREYMPVDSLLGFFAQVAGLCVIYAASVYLLALDPNEQAMAKGTLLKLRSRATA